MPDYTFAKNVRVALKSNVPGAKLHYTVTQVPHFNGHAAFWQGADSRVGPSVQAIRS